MSVLIWQAHSVREESSMSDLTAHTIHPNLLRHILGNLHCLLIRDAVLDLFTEIVKTPSTLLDPTHADLSEPCWIYRGKLLNIDGQLYSVTDAEGIRHGSNETVTVSALGVPVASQLCQRNNPIVLQSTDIANYQGSEPLHTTTGRLLLNYVILVDPFGSLVPYVNAEWKIGAIEEQLVDYLFTGRLTVNQIKHYSRNIHWLGHFTELAVPNFTERSLTIDPKIIARRDELLKQHRAEIDAGDAVVMSRIESELVAMDRESLKGDVSTLFYDRDSKSYDNHRKATMILGGMVQNFTDGEKKYSFIENSLEEGWNAENIPIICNEIRRGSYARAKQTAKGGEETKFIIRVFQNTRIIEEDCGTTYCLHVNLTRDMAKKYLYRNIIVDERRITLGVDVIEHYVGQVVRMRSPLYCGTKNGYCYTCMGELFRSINQELITMIAVNVSSSFTLAALKSKHVTQAKRIEVRSLDRFVV